MYCLDDAQEHLTRQYISHALCSCAVYKGYTYIGDHACMRW